MSVSGLEIGERTLTVWGGRLELTVQVAGEGAPLLYLHSAAGMAWDPFLARLASDFTVYAPQVPGTTPGKPDAIRALDDIWDLVLVYEETIRGLGLEGSPVIGQSFGGMLALELAAVFPAIFSRVIVLDPIGLWLDEHPVANWVAATPEELAGMLFTDPNGEVARAALALPEDPDAAVAAIAAASWAIGSTAKFVWPIPDKGLAKRLHRIEAPTLIVWGKQDKLISSVYAEEFGRQIAASRVEVLDECGHVPQLEQPEKTLALVTDFLGVGQPRGASLS